MRVQVVREILSANDQIAQANQRLLDENGILAVNLMASPGAGKTSLILATIAATRGRARLGVIEGDLASRIDADRVAREKVPVVQINTGGGCHLDAPQVSRALESLPLEQLDILLIENVGNLVCPANFRLGAHRAVVIASVPEGDDKPFKYPGIFAGADAVVLNKTDLLPYIAFDLARFRRGLQAVNPKAPLLSLSCASGQGLPAWVDWLLGQFKPR
ncbi:MAG: hydrogenase nickel incorporation protein HypB [Chloroflexi bacterium]|nr:hydrogenase nickel incorporation protein HypB [Chloroflexota bacterium]MBI5956831.1 hydrogenase nickel incorporation protein HypB [Chloroflexota bacterium]